MEKELKSKKLADVIAASSQPDEIKNIFAVRRSATAILHQIRGSKKPVSFIEDAAIAPELFSDFLLDCQDIMDSVGIDFVMFGHAGNGNLHIRPLMDLRDAEDMAKSDIIMTKFVKLVKKYRGSLSGEHGDGRLRTPFLPQFFPKLMPLFKKIKQLFDPDYLLNPGIIIQEKENLKWRHDLRYGENYPLQQLDGELSQEKWIDEIQLCHGCGTCRAYCPVFIATGDESATGRAKSNLLRGIIKGDLAKETMADPGLLDIMELCVNCGQCLTDCPTHVDIPALTVLAKKNLHKNIPWKKGELLLQNGKILSELGSMTRPFSNIFLNMGIFRSLLEGVTGIDKRRNLAKFEHSIVEDKVFRPSAYQSEKQVVLWSGCAANYNDSKGEQAHSQQFLEKMGYKVVHPEWRCCNIAKISHGNLDACEEDLEFNLQSLSSFAENNIPIVFSSATSGYAFRKEYQKFFNKMENLALVQKLSFDIHDFIGKYWDENKLSERLEKIDLHIVYHEPCHLKGQKNSVSPLDLLRRIPGLKISDIKDSCCGIAGTFGLKKQYFDLSMKMGEPLFSEIKEVKPQLVVSGCSTCQIQIHQGSGIPVIHPMILLNRALRF